MISLKQLLITEGFEKVSDLLSNPENDGKHLYQLLNAFKESGGEILGQGKYSTILFYPSWKYVIKIFSDDVPYLKFVRFCLKNPRKSFPVFYDKPRRIIPNYKRHRSRVYLYVVKTEKLNPINIREYDNIQYYLYYNKEYAKELSQAPTSLQNWEFIYNKLIKLEHDIPSLIQFKEDYMFLMNGAISNDFGSQDISSKNIMKRDNGEYVLSDPFWEGETPYQTYDRLLKAEIGYDEDEYRERDMVKGGEIYKKPKPIKPSKPSPVQPGEDVPF